MLRERLRRSGASFSSARAWAPRSVTWLSERSSVSDASAGESFSDARARAPRSLMRSRSPSHWKLRQSVRVRSF